VRRGCAHRGVAAGGEVGRGVRRGGLAGAGELCLHGYRRPPGRRTGDRRQHRHADRIRTDRRRTGEKQAQTAFEVGLSRFSRFLFGVAAVLTVFIFVVNVALSRPLIEALLFSLAIAVGIAPEMMPAS